MNVVDSSAWIEYFTEGPNAGRFARPIEQVEDVIIPSLCIYEVFKWVLCERDKTQALKAAMQMQLGNIMELDSKMAILAARLNLEYKLPMADSIVFATAHARDATLWTQDADFENIQGVQYFPKIKK